ncbi:IS66 family transposase [Tranquillimonas rosea]|uniref:IS66 family transposase n=1 Tax=Tranquillimonas rosea TaxID=641238 RepID=UPI003BAA35FF
MRANLRGADRIFVDETRAPVLDPGRKATKSGYFWAVVSDGRGHGGTGPPIVLFHYAPGRGKQHPLKFLAGYRGRFLQCDAYQSYNALPEIERANGPWQLVYCWTHVRRRFVKRFENEGSPITEEMLRRIAALYGIEKAVRGKDPAVRLAARREHAAPIIGALKPWLETQLSSIPQKSRLAEDIRYTLAHWPGLIRFLDDGTLELDTDAIDKTLMPVPAILSQCGRPRGEAWRVGWKRRRAAHAVPAGLRRPHTRVSLPDVSARRLRSARSFPALARRSAFPGAASL